MFGLEKQDLNVTENRNIYVGGSDVPTILGINKYKTQFELALEKTGLVKKEFVSNPYTQFGNHLEPQIREFINDTNGTQFVVDTFIDNEKMIRSNVDGIDKEFNMILEIKTHGKSPTMAVYIAQMQLYMYQTKTDLGWLATYERPEDMDIEFDKDRLKIEEVQRDDAYIQKILKAIETFWIRCEYLKEKPDMTEAEFMTYGTDMDKVLVRLNDLTPKIAQYKKLAKALEVEEKAIKEELYQKMEENDIKSLSTPLATVTRILPSKVKRFDSTEFKKDHPDIYTEYEKESDKKGYLTIKIKKEEDENAKKAK